MGLQLSSCISYARTIINDTIPDSDGVYRYSDPDLLEYGNGAIGALAELKAHWLYAETTLTCATGKALQSKADVHAIVSVNRIQGGNVVLPCDKAALDAFMPGWVLASNGAAQNWMPHNDDPRSIWIYPPAPAAQVLEITVIHVPTSFAADADTGLPLTLKEAIGDYIVGMAESRDDEHVLSGRAAVFTSRLAERLGLSVPKG